MQSTLIGADDTLWLWTFLMLAAATAIVLEQRARWAAKVPGAVIALLIAIAASNIGLVPLDAPVYDAVWGVIVPMAIPLLLFQLNLHAIFKESRRLLILFLISSVGTVIGTFIAYFMLQAHIPELAKIAGMISASYTGGSVNFAAMAAQLQPSDSMKSAAVVADNLMMACYFIILITLAGSPAVRRIWGSSEQNTNNNPESNRAADYWKGKAISLQNIAMALGAAALVVAISFSLSSYLKTLIGTPDNIILSLLVGLLTDKYLLLTTLTFLLVLLCPKGMASLNGSQELGTYCIYIFFVVIGIPASIPVIIQNAPLLFVFTLTIALINLIVTLIAGKLFKYSIEEITLACNANIGGPTTAAALAISQGWRNLVAPIMIIGVVGYVIGNYIGNFVYNILTSL